MLIEFTVRYGTNGGSLGHRRCSRLEQVSWDWKQQVIARFTSCQPSAYSIGLWDPTKFWSDRSCEAGLVCQEHSGMDEGEEGARELKGKDWQKCQQDRAETEDVKRSWEWALGFFCYGLCQVGSVQWQWREMFSPPIPESLSQFFPLFHCASDELIQLKWNFILFTYF